MDLDNTIIRVRINNAQISERGWSFPTNSSIIYRGYFGEPGSDKVTGCENFIDQNGQAIIPEFRFEYWGNNAPHITCDDVSLITEHNNFITDCASMFVQLSGEINLRITNISGSDEIGVNCYS